MASILQVFTEIAEFWELRRVFDEREIEFLLMGFEWWWSSVLLAALRVADYHSRSCLGYQQLNQPIQHTDTHGDQVVCDFCPVRKVTPFYQYFDVNCCTVVIAMRGKGRCGKKASFCGLAAAGWLGFVDGITQALVRFQ